MQEVFPVQVIESSEHMVKVTFVAKEQGFYKVIFSNSHSWMRAKTLKFRYIVLRPVQAKLASTQKVPQQQLNQYMPPNLYQEP